MGLSHILENNNSVPMNAQMQEDLSNVGRLVLVMATMSLGAYHDIRSSIDHIQNRFSSDLSTFVRHIFGQQNCSLNNLFSLTVHRLADHIDEFYNHSDALEEYLCKQLESERLSRILVKLNLVNDRPENAGWSETGDRYILKLFHDYVFHQTDDNTKAFVGKFLFPCIKFSDELAFSMQIWVISLTV